MYWVHFICDENVNSLKKVLLVYVCMYTEIYL